MRCAIALGILLFPAAAYAADPNDSTPAPREKDARDAAPIAAYAYGVHGTTAGSVGAQVYGLGLAAPGQRAIAGGGGTAWGSPIERLVLVGDGARDVFGNFAPSAAAIVRLVGRADEGWSLGALGKYKIEGFGVGPNDEIESELESGLLLSYARWGWHLDANAIGGVGLGDGGEIDTEGRLRFGRDFGRWFRLGADGQARMRVSGTTTLASGRTWDFAAGPQAIASFGNFFGALTAGPATTGVSRSVGWSGIVSFGGAL